MMMPVVLMLEFAPSQNVPTSVERANDEAGVISNAEKYLEALSMISNHCQYQTRLAFAGDANDVYLKGLLKRLLLRVDYFVQLHYY